MFSSESVNFFVGGTFCAAINFGEHRVDCDSCQSSVRVDLQVEFLVGDCSSFGSYLFKVAQGRGV